MENIIILILVIIIISIFVGGSLMMKIMRGFHHHNYPMPIYSQNGVPAPIHYTPRKSSNSIIHVLFISVCVVGFSYMLLEGQLDSNNLLDEQYVVNNENSKVLVDNKIPSKEYVIQLYSMLDYFEIAQWCDYYKGKGFNSFILQSDSNYKLVVGSYATMEEAKEFEARYFSEVNSWIRLTDSEEVVFREVY